LKILTRKYSFRNQLKYFYYTNIIKMSHGYGKESHAINEGIKGGDAGKLKSNQDVRKYAQGVYKDAGLTNAQIKSRMAHKDAGHIIAKNCGGRDSASNYMWEDRHNNRAHGDDPITKAEMKKAGRL
jgi:hypothetical protein